MYGIGLTIVAVLIVRRCLLLARRAISALPTPWVLTEQKGELAPAPGQYHDSTEVVSSPDDRLLARSSTRFTRHFMSDVVHLVYTLLFPETPLVLDVVPSKYLTMDPEAPVDLPIGRYTITGFNWAFMNSSFRVENDGEIGYLVNQRNEIIPIPNACVVTGCFSRKRYTVVDGVLVVSEGDFGCQYPIISIMPCISHFSASAAPEETVISWFTPDRVYLKLANSAGSVWMHKHTWPVLLANYRLSSIVSNNSIDSFIRQRHPSMSDATRLRAVDICKLILGGEKGLRQFRYFSRDLAIESLLEEPLPDTEQSHISSSSKSIITWPGATPAKCTGSDADAILERLYKVNMRLRTIPEYIHEAARMFINELTNTLERADVSPIVVPAGEEEVIEQQKSSKTRQKMFQAAELMMSAVHRYSPVVSAFVKTELYSAAKKCRNISAMEALHNLMGFRFDIVLKKLWTYIPCYFPGLKPAEIVAKLQMQLNKAAPLGYTLGKLFATDFSNMDGTECEALRRLIFSIMRAFISPFFRDQFDVLINNHFATKCFFAKEFRYEHLGSMFSGAFCTTNGNTLLTSLMIFTALIRLGLSPRAAFHHLGCAFGDDTVMRDLIAPDGRKLSDMIQLVAADMGLSIKIEETYEIQGVEYFNFLSRWYGMANGEITTSCVDIARMLPKFQTLTIRDATPAQFMMKFSCLLSLAGRNVPIISNYIMKYASLQQLAFVARSEVSSEFLPYWLTLCEENDEIFPSADIDILELCMDLAAKALRVDSHELFALSSKIDECSSMDQLNEVVLCCPPPVEAAHYVYTNDSMRMTTRELLTTGMENA